MTPPIFDPIAIDRMRKFGGAKLVRQMLALFFKSTPERYEQMIIAHRSGDLEAVRITAHSLKSSAGNLGASRLQFLAQDLESTADAGDAEKVGSILASAQAVIAPTLEALRELPEAR